MIAWLEEGPMIVLIAGWLVFVAGLSLGLALGSEGKVQ
jgi:hypothetical protein